MKVIRLTDQQHMMMMRLLDVELSLDQESRHINWLGQDVGTDDLWAALRAATDFDVLQAERIFTDYGDVLAAFEAWDRGDPDAEPFAVVYARACVAEIAIRELIGLPVSESLRQTAAQDKGEAA